jgi:hypothetical protein
MAEVKHNFDDLRNAALPQFPRAMYHDVYGSVLVSGPEELKALGTGWRDHPEMDYAKFVTGEEKAQAKEEAPAESEAGDEPKRKARSKA